MNENLLEELGAFAPLDFFDLETEGHYCKKFPPSRLLPRYSLPDPGDHLGEDSFAKIFFAWNEEGVYVGAEIDKPFEEGDSLELFFDTRDLKTAGSITRFCHHFLIKPKESAQEITRFRAEESHPLCDPSDIALDTRFGSSDYRLQITFPSSCLHGYDPSSFDRLGFTYRLNRAKGEPQCFSVSSASFAIEKNPALWASLKLIK